MAWVVLGVAAIFETAFALSIKPTHGFTRPGPTLAVIAFGTISVYLLSRTLDCLPVGTAYAAWTGIGTIGAVAAAAAIYHEPVTVARLGCISLILAGVVGLRLTGTG